MRNARVESRVLEAERVLGVVAGGANLFIVVLSRRVSWNEIGREMRAAASMAGLAADPGEVGLIFDQRRLRKTSAAAEGRSVTSQAIRFRRLADAFEALYGMAVGARLPGGELGLMTGLAGIGSDRFGRCRQQISARSRAA